MTTPTSDSNPITNLSSASNGTHRGKKISINSPTKASSIRVSTISKKTLQNSENLGNIFIETRKPQANNEGLLTEIMFEVNKITSQDNAKKINQTLKNTSKELPKPSLAQQTGESMILYRGCRPNQLAKMLVTGSAGGQPANANTGKPTEESAKAQVGERESIPEFTTSFGISQSFGRGHILIAVSINKKLLKEGSVVESGMVCHHDAPIKLLAWKQGLLLNYLN